MIDVRVTNSPTYPVKAILCNSVIGLTLVDVYKLIARLQEVLTCVEGASHQNSVQEAVQPIVDSLKQSDNECTRAPWWSIIDPRQQFRCDVHKTASMITGPFFSREDAEAFLKATRYNFGNHAEVYCHSGCYSKKYSDFYDAVESIKR